MPRGLPPLWRSAPRAGGNVAALPEPSCPGIYLSYVFICLLSLGSLSFFFSPSLFPRKLHCIHCMVARFQLGRARRRAAGEGRRRVTPGRGVFAKGRRRSVTYVY